MPDLHTRYEITDDGVKNPPVIREFEQRVSDAAAAGDTAQLDVIMDDYNAERRKIAERHNARVDARQQEDRRLLAEAESNRQRDTEAQQVEAAERAEREEAERIRQQNAGTGDSQ